MAADGLQWQYIMNEQAGSVALSDSSGNNGPMLPLYTYAHPSSGAGTVQATNPTVAFQSGNSPVEASVPPTVWTSNIQPITSRFTSPLPSPLFGATIPATPPTTGPSSQFQGQLPYPLNTNNALTVLCWCWPNVAATNWQQLKYFQHIAALGNTRTGAMVSLASIPYLITDPQAYMALYSPNFLKAGYGASGDTVSVQDFEMPGPFMVAMTINANQLQCTVAGNFYATGYQVRQGTGLTIPTTLEFNYLSIGGPLGGGNGFIGNISLVCVYNQALDLANLTRIGYTGAFGSYGLSTGGAFSKALTYT